MLTLCVGVSFSFFVSSQGGAVQVYNSGSAGSASFKECSFSGNTASFGVSSSSFEFID